ncbi:MAG: hypothetical protein MZU91_13470 [Desulfosudis oleivorans]|nr:hypothetical protein [Desulfosudis oleivorans]
MSWSVTGYEGLFAPPAAKDHEEALHSDHAPRSVKFFLDGANRTAACMPVVAGLKAAFRAAKDSISSRSLCAPAHALRTEDHPQERQAVPALPALRGYRTTSSRRARFFTEKGYRLVMHALGNVAARQAAELVVKDLARGGSSVEHMLVMDDEEPGHLCRLRRCRIDPAGLHPRSMPMPSSGWEYLPYLKAFPLKSLTRSGGCRLHQLRRTLRARMTRCTTSGGPLTGRRQTAPCSTRTRGSAKSEALTAGTIGGSRSLGLQERRAERGRGRDLLRRGRRPLLGFEQGGPDLDRRRRGLIDRNGQMVETKLA